MSEGKLLREIQAEASKGPVRLFRNNTGSAWQGQVIQRTAERLVLGKPRPVRFGLTLGSSDLIGWRTVAITEDMVGREIAVFTAFEVKTQGVWLTDQQAHFLEVVKRAGGLAEKVDSVENAAAILASPL